MLELRYGLAAGEPMTLEAIGSEVGVTRERVRQIESRTLVEAEELARGRRTEDTMDEEG